MHAYAEWLHPAYVYMRSPAHSADICLGAYMRHLPDLSSPPGCYDRRLTCVIALLPPPLAQLPFHNFLVAGTPGCCYR